MTRRIVICALLSTVLLHSYAQMPFFERYRLLKKNDPVNINSIFQDRDGFLWFGTDSGLFRYDGHDHVQFTIAEGLPENEVTAICQDSAGRIWIGHATGQLSVLNGKEVSAFNPPEGSAVEPVSDIIFDLNGTLWFSTRGDGLYYYLNERLYRLDEMDGMPDAFVYDLVMDSEGDIWGGTDGGVIRCQLQNGKASIEVFDNEDGLPDNIVKRLSWSSDGKLMLATEDAGMVTYDPVESEFRPLLPNWTDGSITDFALHGESVWVSTRRHGLLRFDLEDRRLSRLKNEPGYDLPDISVTYTDREGNLWAGTKEGLFRSAGAELQYIVSLGPATNPNVLAVSADRNGDLWFSTPDGLFRRTQDLKGNISFSRPLAGTPYEKYTVISLYCDDAGSVWAGLYGEGLIRINTVSGKVQYFNNELRNGNVLHITGDANTIWLATLGGAERISIEEGETAQIKNFSRESGLASDFIYQVFRDSRGRIWLATDGRGVNVITTDDKIEHFEEGLPSRVVYGFAEDSVGNIWLNVQGNGLYRFSDGKFSPLETSSQLRSNDVFSMMSDRHGKIIAASDAGIEIIDPVGKTVRFRGEEYGLRDKIPTLNAISRDSHSNMYIGTSEGIVRFSSDNYAVQNYPGVFIDEVKAFDTPLDLATSPLLSHDENSITIGFHGIWFQNPRGLLYRYKMENYDEDWIPTSDNAVTYSRLPPGDYVFHVMSSENDDFGQSTRTSVSFTITPPFWTTTPFYVTVVAVGLILGYSFVRYRERQLINDKIILEQKVEERTLEIQRKTEEIQAQNEEIMAQAEEIKGINENLEMLVKQRTAELEKKNKALEEYAFINAHKLRSPVASVLGLINLISRTHLDEEARVITKHLQQAADELDEVVRSITKAIERGEK